MRKHDVLLIVGKGETWREDMEKMKALNVPHDVMGINCAAMWINPCPMHGFSYHPETMDRVKAQCPSTITHSLRPSKGVDHYYRLQGEKGGSSSYLACRIALEILEYSRIVLAGVPLSGQYFIDYAQQWINGRNRIMGHVKSFSGATYALLGPPTKEWLCA